ncbi:MAG: cytochrome c oxidase subunit I, partial [Pseudomonadota bacterium]
ASFLFFLYVMYYTLTKGEKVTEPNYWEDELGTLEWTLPNPPPEHTFETLPKREEWDKQPAH